MRLLGLCCAIALTSCRADAPVSSSDATLDGSADAALDTATRRDSALDALDATSAKFGKGWHTVPGIPCAIYVADDPATVFPAPVWDACPSGKCSLLRVTWGPSDWRLFTLDSEPVQIIRGRARLRYAAAVPDLSQGAEPFTYATAYSVVQALDGPADYVLGDDYQVTPVCDAIPYAGNAGILFAGSYSPVKNKFHFGFSTWDKLSDVAGSDVDASTVGALIQAGGQTSDNATFIDSISTNLVRVALPERTFSVIQDPSGKPARLELPVVSGPNAIAFDYTAGSNGGLAFIDAAGKYTQLFKSAAPHFVSSLAVDRSASPPLLVWAEADDTGEPIVTANLFTSPIDAPSSFAPRKVATITNSLGNAARDTIANAGYALTLTAKNTAQVTRLSDGAVWTFSSEPGYAFTMPAWVDATDVYVFTALDKPAYLQYTSGMQRVHRDGP